MVAALHGDACLHVRVIMIAMDVIFKCTKPHTLKKASSLLRSSCQVEVQLL
jgi:hypothetical protein